MSTQPLQDYAGKWSYSLQRYGEYESETWYLTLKQHGSLLTGECLWRRDDPFNGNQESTSIAKGSVRADGIATVALYSSEASTEPHTEFWFFRQGNTLYESRFEQDVLTRDTRAGMLRHWT